MDIDRHFSTLVEHCKLQNSILYVLSADFQTKKRENSSKGSNLVCHWYTLPLNLRFGIQNLNVDPAAGRTTNLPHNYRLNGA